MTKRTKGPVQLVPKSGPEERKRRLSNAVEFFYDLQKLRIGSGQRNTSGADDASLDEVDKVFLERTSDGLNKLERDALKEVERYLTGYPIYEAWLKDQRGIGPTMAGVLCASIDINIATTPSKLWAFAGLAVVDGHSQRREKGQKANFNPWLKAKLVKVMADCLLRANSPWRSFYDNYKTRKQNQLVPKCMLCEGKGMAMLFDDDDEKKGSRKGGAQEKKTKTEKKCPNCDGTGGPAPWGRSDAHRHQASLRYMVKMFLLELWKQWRTLEGLDVRVPYAEEFLGRVHHG